VARPPTRFLPQSLDPLPSALSRSLARSLLLTHLPLPSRPPSAPLPSPIPSPPLPLSPLPFSSAAALAFYGVRHAPTRGCMQAREKLNALKTERDALRQELVRSNDSPNRSHRTTHARTRTCTRAHARMHAPARARTHACTPAVRGARRSRVAPASAARGKRIIFEGTNGGACRDRTAQSGAQRQLYC
jgi:hypothetical protein